MKKDNITNNDQILNDIDNKHEWMYNKTLEIGCDTQRLIQVCVPANVGDVFVVSGSSPDTANKPVLGIIYRNSKGTIMFHPSRKNPPSETPITYLSDHEPYSSMTWCIGIVSYSETPDIDEVEAFLLTLIKRNVLQNTPKC